MKRLSYRSLLEVVGLVVALVGSCCTYQLGRASYELELKKANDEAFKKSRSHVEVDHLGDGRVKLTIESYENGYYKKENHIQTEEAWAQLERELKDAPPIPRN